MTLKTVAILSPGDMGHAVGRVFRESGLEVITCLRGRSERTRRLAEEAGIGDAPSLTALVTEADLVLSILVPAEALGVAERVAEALRATGSSTPFADCNAVSPRTTQAMADLVSGAGGRFIDASIIGGPPKPNAAPRFYVSGPHASAMSGLDGRCIVVRDLGDEVGRASGIKMCYAALTKGSSALQYALLTVAERLGLTDELREELLFSQADTYRRMETQLPGIPSKAFRWIGEMEEIAATFEHAGVTPHFHRGAADVYRLVSRTPLADETPETKDPNRTLPETISIVARAADQPADRGGSSPSPR